MDFWNGFLSVHDVIHHCKRDRSEILKLKLLQNWISKTFSDTIIWYIYVVYIYIWNTMKLATRVCVIKSVITHWSFHLANSAHKVYINAKCALHTPLSTLGCHVRASKCAELLKLSPSLRSMMHLNYCNASF